MSLETPAEPPTFPTPRAWARAVHELRDRLITERPRAFKTGATYDCPDCGSHALQGRDDLVREAVAGALAVVHHNLHGARCDNCGTEFLEAYEEIAIEDMGPAAPLADYAAKVTSVSGRNLGTYWPKDLVRAMDLRNQDALRVRILDHDTLVIERSQTSQPNEQVRRKRRPTSARSR